MSEKKKSIKRPPRTPRTPKIARSAKGTVRGQAGGEAAGKPGQKVRGPQKSAKSEPTSRRSSSKRGALPAPGSAHASKTGGSAANKAQGAEAPQPKKMVRREPVVKKPTAKNAPSLVQPPRRRAPVDAIPTAGAVPAAGAPATINAAAAISSEGAKSPEAMPATPSASASRERATIARPSPIPAPYTYDSYPPDADDGSGDPYPMSSDDLGMLGIGSPLFPPDRNLDSDDEDLDLNDETPWNSGLSFVGDDDLTVEMRIREIEERLEGLMATTPHDDLDIDSKPLTQSIAPGDRDDAIDSAREVLESDYYRKKWGHHSLESRSVGVDDFGLDPAFEEKLRPALEFLFQKYFRVEVEGIRNIPNDGRAVIVSNHSGALPLDGVMLREAIRTCHPGRSDFRWLAEDFSFYLPFLGVAMNRIGAVRACPENAERLLSREHLVAVFPEGAEGIKKLFKNRYRLQRFGRGGFVRLCLKTRSPIIPCAVIGAEETNPILHRFDNISKLLGLDYLPITPTFPWLGPLGLIPAPTKWKIVFGEPISLDEYGPQAAQDHVLVGQISERVRTTINGLLETNLRRRKSIWL